MEAKVIKEDQSKTEPSLIQTGTSYSERIKDLELILLDRMEMMVFIMILMIILGMKVWEYHMTALISIHGEPTPTQKLYKERPYGYTLEQNTPSETTTQDPGFDPKWKSSIQGIELRTVDRTDSKNNH
jgi:hypothetical protein